MQKHDKPTSGHEELFVLKRLVWHGSLRRKDIERLLQISSDFASRLIGRVRERVKTAIVGKAYVFDDTSIPNEVGADVFLEDVRRAVLENRSLEEVAGVNLPVFVTAAPDQHVDSVIMQDIVRAIQTQRAVGIQYTGMGAGEKLRNRMIEPVSLVLINERWHVHAFSRPDLAEDGTVLTKGGWRDFVLSRISRTHGLADAARYRLEHSPQMKIVERTLVPHPQLTPDQQKVVARAWSMVNDQLEISMPETQWFYFMDRYVANPDEGPPEKLLVEFTGY